MLIKNLSDDKRIVVKFLQKEITKESLDMMDAIIHKCLMDKPRDIHIDMENIESVNMAFIAKFLFFTVLAERAKIRCVVIKCEPNVMEELFKLSIDPKNYSCSNCLNVDTCPHRFGQEKRLENGICTNKRRDAIPY